MKDKHIPPRPGSPAPPPEHGDHGGHKRRKGHFARRMRRLLIRIVVIALIAVVLLLGYNYYKEQLFNRDVIATESQLTDTTVMRKLEGIGEFASYQYTFSNIREIRSTKQIFGVNIPGTTHIIRLSYEGVIKVGYQVSEIRINVDNEQHVISVTLPEIQVLDNYIDTDKLSYSEQNNVFNPISGNEITEELDSIKAAELEQAISEGIYEKGEGHAKELITGLLAEFTGFTVVYK